LKSLAHVNHSNVKSDAKLLDRAFFVVHLETNHLEAILRLLLIKVIH